MRAWAAILVGALAVYAAGGRLFPLNLPHELQEGETAILEVTLGRLTTREPIEVRTATGRLLGAMSTDRSAARTRGWDVPRSDPE